jgi:hypothetical protein
MNSFDTKRVGRLRSYKYKAPKLWYGYLNSYLIIGAFLALAARYGRGSELPLTTYIFNLLLWPVPVFAILFNFLHQFRF